MEKMIIVSRFFLSEGHALVDEKRDPLGRILDECKAVQRKKLGFGNSACTGYSGTSASKGCKLQEPHVLTSLNKWLIGTLRWHLLADYILRICNKITSLPPP